jgi:hypothetical protein
LEVVPFIFKVTGGAAAQCLALYNALYISSILERPFKIRHYDFGTGGYYPLAIKGLLNESEIDYRPIVLRGFSLENTPEVGSVIRNHPANNRGINYETFLEVLRQTRVDTYLRRLRGEWVVNGSFERVNTVPRSVRMITGGFPPFVDSDTRNSLSERFLKGGLPDIFKLPVSSPQQTQKVVIQYRLGNKREAFQYSSGAGGEANAVMDPATFSRILDNHSDQAREIYLVSDEPKLAQQLLMEVGIETKLNPYGSDLWSDLKLMAEANLLICPWSTVSQLIIACTAGPNKKIYYPNTDGAGVPRPWQVENVIYYEPTYLSESHFVYKTRFIADPKNHEVYFPDGKKLDGENLD